MGQIALTLPTVGNPVSSEDPLVRDDLSTVQTVINGNLDGDNLATATGRNLGVSTASVVRRGYVATATENSNSLNTFSIFDTVASVVVPTGGILKVAYRAHCKASGGTTCQVGIFLGANELENVAGANTATLTVTATSYFTLYSNGLGLTSDVSAATNVTTGQILGIQNVIFVDPGTYTVSVKGKGDGSNSIFLKDRVLTVETWAAG